MKKALSIFVFCALGMGPLFSLPESGGSCHMGNAGLCMNYKAGFAQNGLKKSCGRFDASSVFSTQQCSSKGIVGICTVSKFQQTIETIFYSSHWTEQSSKIRCSRVRGEFSK